ncbi:aminoglycoside phosphotransferase family protein [Actinopolymorpha sp. B17G11]|uniref:phosphotransferase family protein n=1 Tax=Actinopolymorpha sp. B17G11 TaxID=3160861 RepID=UPI0032E4CC3B
MTRDLMASDHPGWAAVVAETVPCASVRGGCRIGGGMAAETFAIETTDGSVVVKRFRRRRSNAVRFEWERLGFAQRVNAPVPRPLALDTEGRWFDMPALAMTRLPGRLNLHPRDVDGWIQQLAYALVAIHDTDTTGAEGPLLRPSWVQTWRPPKLRSPSPLTDRTVAAIQRHLPGVSWQPVLIHGDFHPGNTLWCRGQLTGIADWCESRLGPASFDLATCRVDMALLLGPAAADRLTHHYAAIAGAEPADLPVFDLILGLDALRKMTRVLRGYRLQGVIVNPEQFTDRATVFLRHALTELGAS